MFGNSADGYLKVYDRSDTEADVTEGSGGVWERLHYDWSDPNHVVMKTTDSNTSGGNSGHVYTFTRNPDGTTDVIVVRDGKNLKGRLLGAVSRNHRQGLPVEGAGQHGEGRRGAQSADERAVNCVARLTVGNPANTGRRAPWRSTVSPWSPRGELLQVPSSA